MSDQDQPHNPQAPQPPSSGQPPASQGQQAIGRIQPVKQAVPDQQALGALPPPPSTKPPAKDEVARRWPVRSAVFLGLLGIFLLFGGFGAWAMLTSIAGAVVAPGQVEVEQNRQVVQHPDGGVIEEILVKEGDRVQSGQVLVRLDGALLQTELAIVEGQYFEILARRGRLEAERADAEAVEFPAELIEAAKGDDELQQLMDGQLLSLIHI